MSIADVFRGKGILAITVVAIVGFVIGVGLKRAKGDDLEKFTRQKIAVPPIGAKKKSDLGKSAKGKFVDRQKIAPKSRVAQSPSDKEKPPDLAEQLIILHREYDNQRMLAIKCLEVVAIRLPDGLRLERLNFSDSNRTHKNLLIGGKMPGDMTAKVDEFRKSLLSEKRIVLSEKSIGSRPLFAQAISDVQEAPAGFKNWFIRCELIMDQSQPGSLEGKATYSIPPFLLRHMNFDPFRLLRDLKTWEGINVTRQRGIMSRSRKSGSGSFVERGMRLTFEAKPADLMLFLRELAMRQEMIRLGSFSIRPTRDRIKVTGDLSIVASVLKKQALAYDLDTGMKSLENFLAAGGESPLLEKNPFRLIKAAPTRSGGSNRGSFGKGSSSRGSRPSPPAVPTIPAKHTVASGTPLKPPLPLVRLTGVLLLREKKKAYLEIRVPGASRPFYHQLQEGESADGVKVIRIDRNRVVIKFEATNEERTVTFPEDDPAKARPSSPPKTSPGRLKTIPSRGKRS